MEVDIFKAGNTCQLCDKQVAPSVQKIIANCFKSQFLDKSVQDSELISKYFERFKKSLKLLKSLYKKHSSLEQSTSSVKNVLWEAVEPYFLKVGDKKEDNLEEKDNDNSTLEKELICKNYLKDSFPSCFECYTAVIKFTRLINLTENCSKELVDFMEELQRKQASHQKRTSSPGQEPAVIQFLPELPEEMWEVTLLQLNTLDDLRNSVNSFKGWKKTLKKKMVYWLFPTMIFPRLFKYLGRKDILNCRVTCSQWCQGVDEFLEGRNQLAPYIDGQSYWEVNRKLLLLKGLATTLSSAGLLLNPYVFEGGSQHYWKGWQELITVDGEETTIRHKGFKEDVVKCHSEVPRRNNRSPLIGRALHVTKIASLSPIFSDFGHHIWYLNLWYGDQKISCLKLVGYLCTVMKIFPNLRHLCVSGSFIYACETFIALTNNGGINYPAFSPQAVGPPLKTLRLELNSTKCYGIDNLLVKKFAGGLGRLEVESWGSWKTQYNWSLLNWQNLTELWIHSQDSIFRKYNNSILPQITPLAVTAPKLRKLGLMYFLNPDNIPEIREYSRNLLEFLNQFKMLRWFQLVFNLEKLLKIQRERNFQDADGVFYQFWSNFTNIPSQLPAVLPQIKIFETNCRPIGKQFLMTFPNLEELVLHTVRRVNFPNSALAEEMELNRCLRDFRCRDPILFYETSDLSQRPRPLYNDNESYRNCLLWTECEKLERQIYDSDVWMFFKNLKQIVFNDRLVTRKFCKQWRRDNITRLTWSVEQGLTIFKSELPNLQHLKLVFMEVEASPDFLEELTKGIIRNFTDLRSLRISCKNLTIANEVMTTIGSMESADIPSIQYLELEFLPIYSGLLKKLAGVKNISIYPRWRASHENWKDPCCYDEILSSEAINEASISNSINYKERVYESQIWDILPALETMEWGGRVYTREKANYTSDEDDSD